MPRRPPACVRRRRRSRPRTRGLRLRASSPPRERPIPADTVSCAQPVKPAVTAVAQVSDPAAPKITVAVPDGWSVEPGSGDVGVRMQGPDGMFATVTIAQTKLDPAEAFTEYADKVMAVSAVSSVSVLPAELCGYSGQKLMGAWSDTPQQSVEFLDRIAHIWTNTEQLSGRRPCAGARGNRRIRCRLNGAHRGLLCRHTLKPCSPSSSSCLADRFGWVRRASIRKRRRSTRWRWRRSRSNGIRSPMRSSPNSSTRPATSPSRSSELDPALYPGADPADLVPGALVFRPTAGPVDLRDWRQWWEWRPGACWRHPFGPDSGIDDRLDHPVVQVAYPDAAAYARWAGRRLPSRGRMGVRGSRRQHVDLSVGRRRDAGRRADGQHVAGPLPVSRTTALSGGRVRRRSARSRRTATASST